MKRTIPILFAAMLLAQMGLSQQRDRRVDLKIPCYANVDISTTGQLWMYDGCGHIWMADSMGGSWRTVLTSEDDDYLGGETFEHVAGFGPKTAVAAGYLHQSGYVLRTTDGGSHWDTVKVDPKLIWTRGFCFHPDGRLWIASCSGRKFENLAYSTDSGRTYTSLMPPFVKKKDDENGIEELYMTNANDGYAGTYGNGLYHTTDNWNTASKLTTPLDQGLLENLYYTDTWIHRIRPWRQWLIVSEARTVAYTPIGAQLHWQPMPLNVVNYEVDDATGELWGITDSGQLVLMQDMEHWRLVRDDVYYKNICGTLNGHIYLETPDGVVRIRPDGQADICGFFTEEITLDEFFDKTEKQNGRYGREALPTIRHGGRLWRTDGESIYLQDGQGWYRIAKPLSVQEIFPDPDRSDRIIILLGPGNDAYIRENFSIDTNGLMEPYIYKNPTEAFVHSGLESVTINTYYGGCFYYNEHIVSYKRSGDNLVESENTVDSSWHKPYSIAASSVELALSRLGEQYSLFPTPKDFGLHEGTVDLKEIFHTLGGCTSYAGYKVVFVNRDGDTLTAHGSSQKDCGECFPWLLPMQIRGTDMAFTTCQPGLWKALRPMMPVGMNLRRHLNPLAFLQPCNLLFFSDTAGMSGAVRASTGQYSHVALVESVGDTVWIIDATPQYGVARRPFVYNPGDSQPFPDVYEIDGAFNEYDVLERARSFIGQPYDHAFRPDNRALYCSELIYECFLNDYEDKGDNHFFEAKPMNWRDADGKIPLYWKKHFKKLGIPVPEGVPGTNPTDLSRSPLLKKR